MGAATDVWKNTKEQRVSFSEFGEELDGSGGWERWERFLYGCLVSRSRYVLLLLLLLVREGLTPFRCGTLESGHTFDEQIQTYST